MRKGESQGLQRNIHFKGQPKEVKIRRLAAGNAGRQPRIGYPKKPKGDRISRDGDSPQMQVGTDLAKWRSLGNLVEVISTKNQRDGAFGIAGCYREGIKGKMGDPPT